MGRPRIHAVVTSSRYRGERCKVCRNTTRYIASRRCVVCWENHRKERRNKLNLHSVKGYTGEMLRLELRARQMGLVLDHIVPLTHPLVCGLHAPWNIQLLTVEENSSKRNTFDETLGIAPVEIKDEDQP